MKYAFRIILEGIPDNTSEASIRDAALKVDGVKVFTIYTGGLWMASTTSLPCMWWWPAQITTQQMEVIKNEVRHRLQHLNAQHITIEMELEDQPCALQDC